MTTLSWLTLLVAWGIWAFLVIDTLWKGPRDRGSAFLISGWTVMVILVSVMVVMG